MGGLVVLAYALDGSKVAGLAGVIASGTRAK
jgi:alpha-beta hydrolase superfamily lysophospholipase